MNITEIIRLLITLIFAIITGVLIPFIRSRTTSDQRAQIKEWVKIGVAAAEQIYKGQTGMGNVKKKYVVEFLTEHNLTIDENELDALIESEVFKLGEAWDNENA